MVFYHEPLERPPRGFFASRGAAPGSVSLLGWTSDEVLEAEALPAQDALLLRAQNHPRPQCCACGGAQGLVSLGGRRWLCGACLAAANAASKA